MFDGIYCKEKNSYEVYEHILIDVFNTCISSSISSPSYSPNFTMNHGADSTHATKITSKDSKPWKPGMNVRAIFSMDAEFYEAIIEKIFDDEFALVRFVGYENKEIVSVKTLRPSMGEKVIKEQIKLSEQELEELEETSDNQEVTDECDDLWKEIDWKVGMACRALYDKNDTIYEASVIEVDKTRRTASLEMTGYDVTFEAKFEDMYVSIPEYRVKQVVSARKYYSSKQEKISSNCSSIPDNRIQSEKNVSSLPNFKRKVNAQSGVLKNPDENLEELNELLAENHLPVSIPPYGIMQPENEADALACLISANYLSGYYAGYYDCIRRQQKSSK